MNRIPTKIPVRMHCPGDAQAQPASAALDVGAVGLVAQLGQEAFQVVGEFEVDLPVVEGAQLGAEPGFFTRSSWARRTPAAAGSG